ncbi:MAG TPA: peptidoglycan-binding domain-containing protein [Granulicella sp.]
MTSLLVALSASGFAYTHNRRGPTSPHTAKQKHTAASHPARSAGQRAIDDNRATVIQAALVKQGYLNGEPSGHWDSQTEAAMQKLQSDNGWQTKIVPDSRAIIKLGLGPNHENDQATLRNNDTELSNR